MTIDLEMPEAALLMSVLNQHMVSLNKLETPLETNLLVKIINARNEAIKKGTSS